MFLEPKCLRSIWISRCVYQGETHGGIGASGRKPKAMPVEGGVQIFVE